MADNLTSEDIRRMELYLRDSKRRLALGEAIAKGDFIEWARNAAGWLLDKIDDAWQTVRGWLGLT
jgi:hypothetical protein